MRSFLEIIKEIHYLDTISNAKREIIQKYSPEEADGKYIRFTDYEGENDPIVKNPNPNPEHDDPIGIYAYPLQFFIALRGRVPYKSGAKYIKILEDTSKNKLIINELGLESEIDPILKKISEVAYGGLYSAKEIKTKIMEEFSSRIRMNELGGIGRILFQAIQWDFGVDHKEFKELETMAEWQELVRFVKEERKYGDAFNVIFNREEFRNIAHRLGLKIGSSFNYIENKIEKYIKIFHEDLKGYYQGHARTPKEQTALLLKLGYDAIEDKSEDHKSAIINANEPSQIIFLKRNSFKVLETYDQGKQGYGKENNAIQIMGNVRKRIPEIKILRNQENRRFDHIVIFKIREQFYRFIYFNEDKDANHRMIAEIQKVEFSDQPTEKERILLGKNKQNYEMPTKKKNIFSKDYPLETSQNTIENDIVQFLKTINTSYRRTSPKEINKELNLEPSTYA